MVTDWGWKLPQALASRRVPRDRERQSGQSPLSVTDIIKRVGQTPENGRRLHLTVRGCKFGKNDRDFFSDVEVER